MSDSVQLHRRQPTRLHRPWDSPGKNTGVGCCFLLQCMKVKSEREVAQSCPTLREPMDCNLPGSSVHGIFQARVLEWGAIAFRGFINYIQDLGHYPTYNRFSINSTCYYKTAPPKCPIDTLNSGHLKLNFLLLLFFFPLFLATQTGGS